MLLLHMYAPCAYRTIQLLRLLNIGDKQDKELHKRKDIGTLLLVYSLAFSKRSTATGSYICLGCETQVHIKRKNTKP